MNGEEKFRLFAVEGYTILMGEPDAVSIRRVDDVEATAFVIFNDVSSGWPADGLAVKNGCFDGF